MKGDESPRVGRSKTLLGVLIGPGVNDDINQDSNGCVHPGQGGMSVAPNVDALPPHRLPERLRAAYPHRFPDAVGTNTLRCWQMGAGAFEVSAVADRLLLRPDPERPNQHGLVEPNAKMLSMDYETAIEATRDQWKRWDETC
jgi:hypothetical protein